MAEIFENCRLVVFPNEFQETINGNPAECFIVKYCPIKFVTKMAR
jgi:hypothetical protein